MTTHYAVIIIGSGPAGLTAALFTARADLSTLVISGTTAGGQLLRTSHVSNWPGILDISGPQLIESLHVHAENQGALISNDTVTAVSLTESEKKITLASGTILTANALIIACGGTPKRLNCPGENELWQNGVYTQLPPDLRCYIKKTVAIVGGGNSAIHFASRLLAGDAEVVIIQHLDHLTANDPLLHDIIKDPRLTVLYGTTVRRLEEHERGIRAELFNATTDITIALTCSALFLALGSGPNTELFKPFLALKKSGHIAVTPGTSMTSVPGVFAAGDVCDDRYRHAITSSAQGCMAALDAERFLNGSVTIRFHKK